MSRRTGFNVRGWIVRFSEFSLQELAAILVTSSDELRRTKNSCSMPGLWDGAGAFSSRDVAEMLVRYRLASIGINLQTSGEIGCMGAQSLLWHMITQHAGTCEITGSFQDAQNCVAGTAHSTCVAERLTDLYRPLCHITVGKRTLRNPLGDSRSEAPIAQIQGHLDLRELAKQFAEKVDFPLFKIDVSRRSAERRVTLFSEKANPEFVRSINAYELSSTVFIP